MTHTTPTRADMVSRGVRRACPQCGEPAFETYFRMREHCASCGIEFEREPGYWVGAVIINTTITFLTFVLLFTGLVVATWPDVPWPWVLGATLAANLAIPILLYPTSKTLWAALEMSWHPLEAGELDGAHRLPGP